MRDRQLNAYDGIRVLGRKVLRGEEEGQRAYHGIDAGQAVRGESHDCPHGDAGGESAEQGHEKRLACPVCKGGTCIRAGGEERRLTE